MTDELLVLTDKLVNWLLLLLAPQGFLIYIWEPKIYLQICPYYYGNFQQTSNIHHPSTVLLQHVWELHSTCSNICKMHGQKHSMHSQYASKHSKAQYALCVPVPDHMLCYPFHMIGYWRKSKPILPKFAIQDVVWDICYESLNGNLRLVLLPRVSKRFWYP
jgi:hypothetical protein